MKRKLCFLLAVVLLLLSAVGCADEKADAYELYTAAKERYLSGFEAAISFKMTVGEQSAEGEMTLKTAGSDVSVTRTGSTDARTYVDGVVYRRGYFINGVHYEDTDDSPAKIRTAASKAEFETECANFFCINPYASAFPVLTEEAIENAEVTSSGGRVAFAAELSADAVKAYLCNSQITDASGTLVAAFDENGNMTSMVLQFEISESEAEQKLFEITYTFSNPGSVPSVTAPDNASAYIEL